MIGIYKIESNNDLSKFYIGSSVNITKRWGEHLSALNSNRHFNYKLQDYYNKYPNENFKFSILEECSIDNLLKREQFYIDKLEPYFNIRLKIGQKIYPYIKNNYETITIENLIKKYKLPSKLNIEDKFINSKHILENMYEFYDIFLDIKDVLSNCELLFISSEYELRYSSQKKYVSLY